MLEFEETSQFDSRVVDAFRSLSYEDDLTTNAFIQRAFTERLGGELKIVMGFEGQQPVGMLPLWQYARHGKKWWTFVGNDEILPYNDFLVPRAHLAAFMSHLPPATRLANIHWRHKEGTRQETCPVISLPSSFEAYLQQLKPKIRQNLRRVFRKNADTQVVHNRIEDLGQFQLEKDKNFKSNEPDDVMDADEEVEMYHLLVEQAEHRGLLRMMSFEVGGRLAAINLSFQSSIPAPGRKRKRIVYDQLFLRKPSYDKRFLGIYAIAKNIEWGIREGVSLYDLGQGTYPYKMVWNVRPQKCRLWTNESRP